MAYETIGTHQTISRFHQLMQLQSPYRVLRLSGDGKMGKTHLLTKIFPDLIRQQYQAQCALLDIRNALHTIPDLLEMVCSQLGTDHFQHYYSAHQIWARRPKVEIRGLMAKFSRIDISAKESVDDARTRDRQLTTHFVRDLATFTGAVLLLVDNVSSAPESVQTWLMDNLLVQLSSLSQVRTVIAGRILPEAHGSYQPDAWLAIYSLSKMWQSISLSVSVCRPLSQSSRFGISLTSVIMPPVSLLI